MKSSLTRIQHLAYDLIESVFGSPMKRLNNVAKSLFSMAYDYNCDCV